MSTTAIIGFWVFYTVVTFGACGYAWFRGGPAERQTGGLVLILMIAATAVNALVPDKNVRHMLGLAMDGVGGLLFLQMALRHQSGWLVGCILVMAAQFAIQTIWATNRWDHHCWFALLNNLFTLTLLLILIWATATWRRRSSPTQVRDGGLTTA